MATAKSKVKQRIDFLLMGISYSWQLRYGTAHEWFGNVMATSAVGEDGKFTGHAQSDSHQTTLRRQEPLGQE
jgi:hypothetical protein